MGGIAFSSSSSAFGGSLDVAISGLNAARIALQVTGHNIANVNTPGYARQEAIQVTADPAFTSVGAIGRGTRIIGIESIRDRFLEVQLSVEAQELGRLRATNNVLGQLEGILNSIGGIGLNDVTDNFFGGFHDLAADPESIAQRQDTLSMGLNLASSSNQTIRRLQDQRSGINTDIKNVLGQINTLLEQIAALNTQVGGSETMGFSIGDLRDRRTYLLRQLNELIGVDSFENENGSLTIVTGNGTPLVVQEQHATLSTAANSLDPNVLDVISTFNNGPTNITDAVDSGRLGALLRVRDGTVSDLISAQRRFAAILADVVNVQHRLGTDLDGNAGGDFFNDPFRTIDASTAADIDSVTLVGDNATFEVNYDVVDGSAGADVTDIDIDDPTVLTKHDYRISFGAAGAYTVVDTFSGRTAATGVLAGPGTITFEGLDVTFSAQPADGDYFDLDFAGRTGFTGDVYRIEFDVAGNPTVTNVTTGGAVAVTGGPVTGAGFIFFDGMAVEFDAQPENGAVFTVDYAGLQVADAIAADATLIAASDAAPGVLAPGNNGNAQLIARLAEEAFAGLDDATFSVFQANEISSIGTEKSETETLMLMQETFFNTLESQRESVSGVSLDEEAASLMQYEQAFQASARFIGAIDDLMDFLINVLVS